MKKFLGLIGILLSALLFVPNAYAAGEKAKIGETAYATLEAAYAASQDGDTIVLLEDAELAATLLVQKEITIDLNGKNISRTSEVIQIDGGSLTLIGKGTIKETSPDVAGVRVIGGEDETDTEYSYLSVGKDVTIEAWAPVFIAPEKVGSSYRQFAYGIKVEVAGTLKSYLDTIGGTGSAIYISGNIKNTVNYPIVTVADGAVLDGNDTGVYQAGYSLLTIGKATITATGTGVGTKAGKVVLNGPSIKVTGPAAEPSAYNNGINTVGSAIQIESSVGYAGNIEIEINGGTYESANNSAIVEYLAPATGSTPATTETEVKAIQINDGNFVAKEGEEVIVASNHFKETKKEFIAGGTYSKAVDEYLAEDVKMVEDENGNLVAGVLYNVTVKEAANGKVVVDKTSGLKGTTVKVTATAAEGYTLKAISVVDANGKAVVVTAGAFVMPESDVVVTAEFVEIPKENPETSDINYSSLITMLALGVAGLGYALKKRRFN